MKKIALAAALLTSMAAPAWAAPFVGLYNTGTDATGAKLAGDNQADAHYVSSTGASFTTSNGAYLTDPNAAFIASAINGGGGSSTYTLTFNLLGLDLSTASLAGDVAYDNTVVVRLNGNVLYSDVPGAPGTFDAFQALHHFTATSGFLNGANTLSFEVVDYDAPTGLLVTNLAGNASAVPEPATWAMMLVGFGMVGFGLRRRAKQAVRVTYA